MVFTFPQSKQLTVENEFLGVDSDGYIRSRMTVNGDIPDIPQNAQLAVDDRKDVFLRRQNGEFLKIGGKG